MSGNNRNDFVPFYTSLASKASLKVTKHKLR